MTEEQQPTSLADEEIQARLDPIDEAQRAIAQALQDIHASRVIVDGEEKRPPSHEAAIDNLRRSLQTTPEGVACVSIYGRFGRVTVEGRKAFPGWIGSSLLALQELLDKINPDASGDENVSFELTVRPNYYPKELRRLHFGSRARELEVDVSETMRIAYEWGLYFLDVKPYGGPPGDLYSMDAKPFRLPLQVVQSIELNRVPKPLTPYLEGRNRQNLQIVPVA